MEVEKAAFMGKITAGVTHEIKNVLAIIKESAGLMEDLISFAKENAPPPREKLLSTLTRIAQQVARGVDLSSSLNAFAHSADEKTAGIDLNQALGQTALLCQRFARLKGITLKVVPHDGAIPIVTDPLAFEMLVFRCVDLLMSMSEKGAVISITAENKDGGRAVIAAEGAAGANSGGVRLPSDAQSWPDVLSLAAALNIGAEAGGPPTSIILRFSCA
jgi:signal transduction histidine kinase